MNSFPTDELMGIAEVGFGQALSDELTEWLAEQYGDGSPTKTFAIQGVAPAATGAGMLYFMDNRHAKNVGIGMIATGVVSGARIGLSKVKQMISEASGDSSSDSSEVAGYQRQQQARQRAINRMARRAAQLSQQGDGGSGSFQEGQHSGVLSGEPARQPAYVA